MGEDYEKSRGLQKRNVGVEQMVVEPEQACIGIS